MGRYVFSKRFRMGFAASFRQLSPEISKVFEQLFINTGLQPGVARYWDV
jgi:hypothetical protein